MTTPARTLCDLRPVLAADHLDGVLRKAEVLRLDVGEQPGYVPDRARSELERRVLALCRAHLLPVPEINVRVGPFEVDFLWRDHALIVETDGFRHHGTRSAFEADRARDVRLGALGYRVLRFTHRQVVSDPEIVASILGQMLAN